MECEENPVVCIYVSKCNLIETGNETFVLRIPNVWWEILHCKKFYTKLQIKKINSIQFIINVLSLNENTEINILYYVYFT